MESAAIAVLAWTGAMIVGATWGGVTEFKAWRRARRLRPIITEDQQPAHPPTAEVPIVVAKVTDRRRRTHGLAETALPPEIDPLP